MDPTISNYTDKNNILNFTIENINVSFVNAIRRTILTDIPTVVFKTMPNNINQSTFYKNTTSLNNEILKHRLSCIPIHIDPEAPIDDYLLEVNVENKTSNIMYVTTADFKIKNVKLDLYLNDEVVKEIFPSNKITKQFIEFCRLRPKLSSNLNGDKLHFTCKFSIDSARNNSCYNIVSKCVYKNTLDEEKISMLYNEKKKELEKKNLEEEEIIYELKDWLLLDAKRNYIENSYDFTIETIGIYTNENIILTSIKIIIEKFKNISKLFSSQNNLIKNFENTLPNSYNVYLEGEDYTTANIIEHILMTNHYYGDKSLTYCSVEKPHPNINIIIIKVAFKDNVDISVVNNYIVESSQKAILLLETINNLFINK